METPVTFASDGFQLIGMLHTPDCAPNPAPAVLFLHGFTGTKVEPHRIFVKTAREFVKRGFTALRFDFRGSGDSGGECEDATLSGEIADTKVALDFLTKQPGIDPDRISIVAMSMGAAVACHVVPREPRIKSLVLWSAAGDGATIIQKMASETPAAVGQLITSGHADYQGWRVSMKFVQEFQSMRPVDELAKATCPVLLIHGEKDETVPVAQMALFEKALARNNRKFRTHIIKDSPHTFDRADWEEIVIKETVEWLVKTV
jgi:dipeptidyl aminopeptidase/acylaminoacyl peptidase